MRKLFIKTLFVITDPIVKPARALGMFRRGGLGATALEYGIIAAGVSVAIIALVNGLGDKLNHVFGN